MSKSNKSILIFLLLAILSCKADNKFNQQKWLTNSNVSDTHNRRAYMTDDLMKNHLKVGITKNAVLALLGKPEKDGIENRLPKGTNIPDSLSFTNKENLKLEHNDKAIAGFNNFVQLNAKPHTFTLYPIGWSTIDPNYLIIQLDEKSMVLDFWIEQH